MPSTEEMESAYTAWEEAESELQGTVTPYAAFWAGHALASAGPETFKLEQKERLEER